MEEPTLIMLMQTDGGYIVAGYTGSFGAGGADVYLIKTDLNGDTLWTKTYGGGNGDYCYAVQQTTDGGYIVVGYTWSFGAVWTNVYLIKTDSVGDTLWAKTYGGANFDYGYAVSPTIDGGYIVAGKTSSFGAGGSDVYLIKTDANGNSGCNEMGTATSVSSGAIVGSTATIVGSGGIVNNTATIVSSTATIDSNVCDTTTGINPYSFLNNPLKIYPNPTSREVTIQFDLLEKQDIKISIYNIIGKLVYSESLNNSYGASASWRIDFSELSKGMYLIQIQAGDKLINKKLIYQ